MTDTAKTAVQKLQYFYKSKTVTQLKKSYIILPFSSHLCRLQNVI